MSAPTTPQTECRWMAGGGAMGERMRAHDWAATPLGPPDRWPQSLRTVVGVMLESRQAMFVAWGPELIFLYNDAYIPIFGAKHPAALGHPFAEVWSDIWPQIEPLVRQTLAGDAPWFEDLHIPMERKGYREDAWFTFSYTPVRGECGTVEGMFCAAYETTGKVLSDRRTAFRLELESRLRGLSDPLEVAAAAEEALGTHLGASRVGYGMVDETARWFTTERNWTDGSVTPRIGTHDLEAFGPEVVTALRRGEPLVVRDAATDPRTSAPDRLAAFRALEMASVVTASLVKDGRMVAALYVHDRRPRDWRPDEIELVQDVAERTWSAVERARAEQSLRLANAVLAAEGDRLRELFRQAPGFMYVWRGPDHVYEMANDAYFQLVGHRDILGKPTREALPEIVGQGFLELADQVYASGKAFVGQGMPARLQRTPGAPLEERFVTFVFQPIRDADGEVAGLFVQGNDVTESKRAENALRELNATLEQRVAERTADRDRMWRLSTDIMLVARMDGTISAVNPAWTGLLGWSDRELIGNSFFDLVHPDDLEATRTEAEGLAAGLTTLRFENRYRCKDGGYRWISWTAVPDEGFIHAVGRDVSARREADAALRRAEEQLRQAQKMEAVGQLTGGVAHDFNNLLQVIGGNLQLLLKDVAGNGQAEHRVRNALGGVSRGAKLASSLLAFARRQPLEPRAVNLGRLVRSLDDMLRRALGEEVEVETVTAAGLWNTLADPTQVENALLNLAINARDAMGGRGQLTIEAGNAWLDDEYAERQGDVKAGQYVMLAVTDTGCGMPREVMERAFEPFFSTKPEGQGTGLGLSMVYGFVKQSGGHVRIYSEPGQGTTVRLYLPRTHQREDVAVEVEAGPVQGGSETVLVVEDDAEVRATVVEMLGDLGYRVLQTPDAESALAVLESGVAVDLLFTDVVMPGPLRSPDLARKAVERQPGLAVLFTSGYTQNAIVHGGRLDAGVELLSKPYTREALARKLRHVLRNRQQRQAASPVSATPPSAVAAPADGASLHILLVEDDALIRMTTAEMLDSLGHDVSEAADAEEALALLEAGLVEPGGVDLLLTDLSLPGLSGAELARRARMLLPDLPVIFASGYDLRGGEADGQGATAGALGGAIHLPKPYDLPGLADAVRKAAGARPLS